MSVYFQNKEHVVVGVISDTHGVLLPAAIKALHGVDLIIHAGDIGNTGVMDELKSMAPVVAVRGNMDMKKSLKELPETEAIQVGDVLLYIIHDINKLDIAPSEANFNAVIFGHLHYPSVTKHNDVLFVNAWRIRVMKSEKIKLKVDDEVLSAVVSAPDTLNANTKTGLIFLGYPLHAPGKKDKLKDAHLYHIKVPVLFFAGTRDSLCDLSRLNNVLDKLICQWDLEIIDGGDHSFKLLKSDPRTQKHVQNQILSKCLDWLQID